MVLKQYVHLLHIHIDTEIWGGKKPLGSYYIKMLTVVITGVGIPFIYLRFCSSAFYTYNKIINCVPKKKKNMSSYI